MKNQPTIPASTPYGRVEVKAVIPRNMVKGLLFSVALHLLVIGTYYAVQYVTADDDIPVVRVRVMKYSDLGPPPSIAATPPPPSIGVAQVAKPSVGVPIPVPDAEVSPEQTIATQQELSSTPSPSLEQFEGGGNIEITQDIVVDGDAEPGINEFIPVEKPPQVVKRVIPKYPEMALRAGVEGTVWVKILVDKDGKPLKAVVTKSSTEIFDQAAIEAAMQFQFTPAVMNNGPVKVWVAIPFRFRLKDTAPS
jgi:protein TonB